MKEIDNEKASSRRGCLELRRTYRFEAAHYLPEVPVGHQCRGMHGHSYVVEVAVVGPIDEAMGWVLDFAKIDDVVKPVIEELDHGVLNDSIVNPTSELLAVWLWSRFEEQLAGYLREVVVQETARSRCIYRGSRS